MKKYSFKYLIRVITAVAGVSLAMGIFGHGCGNLKSSKGGSSGLGATCGSEAFESVTIDVSKDTLAILYGDSVLQHFATCTGLNTNELSDKTYAEMTRRETAFSDYGNVLDVTAPLLMGALAVSGEVCDDVVEKESGLPIAYDENLPDSGNRKVFFGWDFSDGAAGCPDEATLNATIARIAVDRNCWSHAGVDSEGNACSGTASEYMACQYPIELAEIKGGISRIMNDSNAGNTQNTRTCAITLCASMLANMRGILNK